MTNKAEAEEKRFCYAQQKYQELPPELLQALVVLACFKVRGLCDTNEDFSTANADHYKPPLQVTGFSLPCYQLIRSKTRFWWNMKNKTSKTTSKALEPDQLQPAKQVHQVMPCFLFNTCLSHILDIPYLWLTQTLPLKYHENYNTNQVVTASHVLCHSLKCTYMGLGELFMFCCCDFFFLVVLIFFSSCLISWFSHVEVTVYHLHSSFYAKLHCTLANFSESFILENIPFSAKQ